MECYGKNSDISDDVYKDDVLHLSALVIYFILVTVLKWISRAMSTIKVADLGSPWRNDMLGVMLSEGRYTGGL